MTKFLMTCPAIVEGKLLPIEPKPSKTKRALSWLKCQTELIADDIKMVSKRVKDQIQNELSHTVTLVQFISPAIKIAAIVIIGDCLSYAIKGAI